MHSQSDDEDDEYQEARWIGKDGIIFMVDATEPMFTEDEDGESAFRMCLKGCDAAMQHKIMFSSSDLMSVVLFGTEASKNESNLSHITVLQELQRPDVSNYKQLRTMHESKTYDGVKEKYGHNDDYLFADLLWLAHLMYGKTTTKLATSRILLLTCSEVLGKDDPHSKRQAVTRAKDLRGDLITLDIIPCSADYQSSDFLKTLMNIVEGLSGTWSLPVSHCIASLQDIPKVIEKIAASKDQRSRCLGHIPFKIGEGLKINVEVYNLVRQAQMPSKKLLSRITNDEVKPSVQHYKCTTSEVVTETEAGTSEHQTEKRITLDQDSKELLMKFDIAKYQIIGGERVKFSQEELKTMRKLMDPGLTLLGFVPVSLLKKTHHCNPASFIYPDKLCTKGARDLFTALWQRIGVKNKAAICSYVLRAQMLPRFVALIPAGMDGSERMKLYQKRGIHTLPDPQGFHLLYLPFSDYVNSLGLPEKPSAYPQYIDCAIGVLRKLRIVFHPSLFPNPAIETHWAAIEAIALERPAVRDVVDEISPNYPEMDDRLGSLADDFLESVYEADYDPTMKPSKSSVKKNTTYNEQDVNVVKAAKANQKVANLTVDILKAYLRAFGKPVSGKKKAELVADVYAVDD